jgi:tetratricopeptide (TPR) repeat protein
VEQLAPETPQQVIATSSLVIAWMPLQAEAYLRRGRAYFQLKQYRHAADDLGVALGLNPGVNEAQVWFEMGYACVESGRPKQAHAAYSRTVALNPRFDAAWNNRGLLHELSGQLEQALDDYSKALAVNDRNAIAWHNRARLHERLGRWGAVIEDCTRFLALVQGPEQANGFSRRATAYARLGQYREALADYQKLLDVTPDNAPAQNALAWLLATCPDTNLRDPARAVALAGKAVQRAPGNGDFYNTLGAAHYRAGDCKAAVAALDNSMELRAGGDALDWFFLAMAHRKLGDTDEARKWFDQAVDWMNKNGPSLKNKPQLAEELHRFQNEAEEVLELRKK